MKRTFKSLTTQEVLALAIALEEEDGRIFQELARSIRDDNPHVAAALSEMREEEDEHRKRLSRVYRRKYGDEIILIQRTDVSGFVDRPITWCNRKYSAHEIAERVALIELETEQFYERAAQSTTDAELRELFSDLAEAERKHESTAHNIEGSHTIPSLSPRHTHRQLFILQVIQPGLVGLVDGSVSTLAPLFAAAYATHNTGKAFLIGLAASVGAGISMGFAEGMSDDGSLTGRGKPVARGIVTGAMTFVGGIFHALPFLIHDFRVALSLAVVVVIVELVAIAFIRNKYMETPFIRSFVQVVIGGILVFLAGVLIGNS